jgi:hypothetical protein
MNDSPASILFNTDGYEVTITEGSFIDGYQPVILFAGKDELGNVKIIKTINDSLIISSTSKNILGVFFGTSDFILGSYSQQILATLENPIGSGRVIYLNSTDINGLVATKFSTPFLYKLVKTDGYVFGGTVLNYQKRNDLDSNAVGVVKTLPIASLLPGAIWVGTSGIVEYGYSNNPKNSVSFVADSEFKEIILNPGESIALVADANSNDWRHFINIIWSEA